MNKKLLGCAFSIFLVLSVPIQAGLFSFLGSISEEITIRFEENQELITGGLERCASSVAKFGNNVKMSNKKAAAIFAILFTAGCFACSK